MARVKCNFIPWNITDWIADTCDLSSEEYALYHRMLMQFYRDGGVPLTRIQIERIAKAMQSRSGRNADAERTQSERNANGLQPIWNDAIDYILETFFQKVDEGYVNHRALQEIKKIAEKSDQARKNANCRHKRKANVEQTQSDCNADAEQTQSECNADDVLTNKHELLTNTINTTSKDVVTPPALDALHSPELFEQDSSETSDIVELDNDGVPVDPPKTKKRRGGEAAALLFCEAIKSFPDEWKSYIADVRPDLDPEKIFAEFSFYWTVGKGKDKRRTVKGWSSTWQTWIRRQDEPRQTYKPAPMPKRSNPILRTAEEFAAIDYHEGINPDGSF